MSCQVGSAAQLLASTLYYPAYSSRCVQNQEEVDGIVPINGNLKTNVNGYHPSPQAASETANATRCENGNVGFDKTTAEDLDSLHMDTVSRPVTGSDADETSTVVSETVERLLGGINKNCPNPEDTCASPGATTSSCDGENSEDREGLEKGTCWMNTGDDNVFQKDPGESSGDSAARETQRLEMKAINSPGDDNIHRKESEMSADEAYRSEVETSHDRLRRLLERAQTRHTVALEELSPARREDAMLGPTLKPAERPRDLPIDKNCRRKKNKAVHWSPENQVIPCDFTLDGGFMQPNSEIDPFLQEPVSHFPLYKVTSHVISYHNGQNGFQNDDIDAENRKQLSREASCGNGIGRTDVEEKDEEAEDEARASSPEIVSPSIEARRNYQDAPPVPVTSPRGVVRWQRARVKVDAIPRESPVRLYKRYTATSSSAPCLTVVAAAAVSTPNSLRCQLLFVDGGETSKSHVSNKFHQPKYLQFSSPRRCCVSSVASPAEGDDMMDFSEAAGSSATNKSTSPPSLKPPLLRLGVNVELRAKHFQAHLKSPASGLSKPVSSRPPVAPSARSLSNGWKVSTSAKSTCNSSNSPEEAVERITGYRKASQQQHHGGQLITPTKPPLPPPRISGGVRTRVAAARRHFFASQQESTPTKPRESPVDASLSRLEALRTWAREERARLATSTPDLGELQLLELHVRSRRRPSIDGASPHREASASSSSVSHRTASAPDSTSRHRAAAWPELGDRLRRAREQRERSLSLGYLETDIDTLVCRKVQETDLDKTTSMLTLSDRRTSDEPLSDTRAHSADFLAEPNGNGVDSVERTKSELELRIERSLQNLHLPEWYTRSPPPKEGFILGRRRRSAASAGWQGFCSSRASSTSNLTVTSLSGRNVVIPKRMYTSDWLQAGWLRSSRDSLASSRSNADSQWSSSRLSAENVPLASSAFYRSLRKPYLGWRAAASCATSPAPSSPFPGSRPSSPREPSVGSAEWQFSVCWDTSPREAASDASSSRFSYVQSIYNSEQPQNPPIRPPSWSAPATEPRSQLVWMESSFVGANSDPTAPRDGTIEHVAVEDPSSCSYGNGEYSLASADSSIRSYAPWIQLGITA